MKAVLTRRLDYPDHAEEILSLNRILKEIGEGQRPLPPSLVKTVEYIIDRLNHLQLASAAQTRPYNQFEDRV
jgi:hypothetical protein